MKQARRQHLILLVEDDPADQLMVRRALEASPIESLLAIASDGAQALDYLQGVGEYADAGAGKRPDLVLVDLNMPKVSGIDVVRSLRADPSFRYLPIVVMTTSEDPLDVTESYAHGANSYIVKPESLDKLTSTLQTLQQYWFQVVRLPSAA